MSRPPAWRAPITPEPGLIGCVVALSAAAAVQHRISLLGAEAALARWPEVAAWGGFSAIAFSTAYLGLPLWTAFREALAGRVIAAWLAFLGLFFVLGLVGGVVRLLMATAWLPLVHEPGQAMVFVLNAGATVALAAVLCELPAALRRRHREALAAREALVTDLAAARAALAAAEADRARAVAGLVDEALAPRLGAAAARLAAARDARRTDAIARLLAEAGALVAEADEAGLDALRAAADPGGPAALGPALEALAARYAPYVPLRCVWGPGTRALAPPAAAIAAACRLAEDALLDACLHGRTAGVELALAPDPAGGIALAIDGRAPAEAGA